MFDPTALDGVCTICGATEDDFVKHGPRHHRVGAVFARLSSYSAIVARLQWDAQKIDLTPDARAWPRLPEERRRRLTTLLAGFCVAEEAVAEHLEPFAAATPDTLAAWVFFLQRRDEQRHAQLFDRIAAEVLGVEGETPAERRRSARALVSPEMLDLFEQRLPAMAAGLQAGSANLIEGISLYHMTLEGVVFFAGQRALLDDLEPDDALPGIREGVNRVDLDERWHIGFGLRNLVEAQPPPELLHELLDTARDAVTVWGDAVPEETREFVARLCARRLAIAGLIEHDRVAA